MCDNLRALRSANYSWTGLARLALSEQGRVLADKTAALVPTNRPGSDEVLLVEEAARLVEDAQRLLTFAVINERLSNVSWERIGVALGRAGRRTVSRQAAHERYAGAERDFRRRLLYAWLLPERAAEVLDSADHLAEVIRNLNVWLGNREELGDESPHAGLPPMSASERAGLIDQAESLLRTMADGVSEQEHRDLQAGLCRRRIELYEDLAARTPGDPHVLIALSEARERLEELRATGS
ncbi:hypothetical protein [Microbispora sp. NPDC049633]|uniref:hypothetical protein n=1 Tax=Microbispora sp. NPDC049633 TaxID=3154355 RepID=UPI0034308D95